MEATTYRAAYPADAARLAEIYNAYLGKATMDTEPATADSFRERIRQLQERERLYCVLRESHIVGWGTIKLYSPKAGYRFAGETSVFLDPVQRGQGVGRPFKQFLIDQARALGYHHLVARIFADNAVSIHYNQQLGYEWVGIQREVGYIDGEWKDVAIMQLIL